MLPVCNSVICWMLLLYNAFLFKKKGVGNCPVSVPLVISSEQLLDKVAEFTPETWDRAEREDKNTEDLKRNRKRNSKSQAAWQSGSLICSWVPVNRVRGASETDIVYVRVMRKVVHEQLHLFGSCRYCQE